MRPASEYTRRGMNGGMAGKRNGSADQATDHQSQFSERLLASSASLKHGECILITT